MSFTNGMCTNSVVRIVHDALVAFYGQHPRNWRLPVVGVDLLAKFYGEVRYIEDSGMKPVAHDERFGTIYLETVEAGRPIARLKVINRSPEPDGSFRTYWLPINPAHYGGDAGRVPQAASASTWRTTPGGKELFFRDWKDYRPAVET